MLQRLNRNCRGLSPIFATLIILGVVTVLFIPVFIWASGITASTQDSWQQSGVAATERIVIEQVSVARSSSPQSCTIYVRNIGETVVTINDVLISSADGSNTHTYEKKASLYPTPTPTPPATPTPQIKTVYPQATASPLNSVIKGGLIAIVIPNLACVDPNFRITSGTTYTIQVFTTRGVGDTYITVVA